MKNNIRLRRLMLLGMLFLAAVLNAQTDFRPGYVIVTPGDTLSGDIDYRGDLLMGELCKFKDSDDVIKDFYPNDITAFRFLDSKYYVSKEIDNKKVFLEYLIKGEVSIYYMRDERGNHYYLDKEGVRLTEIPYEEGIKHEGDKDYSYKSTRHTGFISVYMLDAPELQSRINSIQKPSRKNLIKLAEDYHHAVCDGQKCIIYEKKQPRLKVNFEGVAGVVNFPNVDAINDKFGFQSGVIAHFWMPKTNEKIYFKTGFLYSQVKDTDGEKYSYLKIPTHIGYLAPSSLLIRPSFSIGLLSPSYSGGVAVRINKRINVGVQSWVDFESGNLPWAPKQLLVYSLLANLHIEL